MPVPSPRNKILPARGNYVDLAANIASLLDGEICYAIDQDQYYQNEGGALVSVGATKVQGALADTSLQPLDNVSTLTNDAGYITLAEVPSDLVTSVQGRTGDVIVTKTDLSIENVDNTSDANKPVSTAQQTALDAKADLVGGFVPTSQIPAIAITEFLGSVGSEAAMLALTGQPGDWCLRTDKAVGYVITGADPSTVTDWEAFTVPGSAVTTINSQVGDVVLGFADVGAASAAQGTLADTATQPGDNNSTLTNDAGYITLAEVPPGDVTSVNAQVGDVVLGATDVGAVPSTGGTFTGNVDIGGDITVANPATPTVLIKSESAVTGTQSKLQFANGTGNTSAISEVTSKRISGPTAETELAFSTTDSSGTTAEKLVITGAGAARFAGTVLYQNTSAPGGTSAIQVRDGSSTVFRVYANGETVIPNTAYFGDGGTQLRANGDALFQGDMSIKSGSGVTTIHLDNNGDATFAGDVLIGGTLPSSPNISLNADGTAEFDGEVTSQTLKVGTGSDSEGQVAASFYGANGGDLRGLDIKLGAVNTTNNALVTFDAKQASNGTLAFATKGTERLRIDATGDVLIGGSLPSSPDIELNADGSARYQSDTDFSSTSSGGMIEFRSNHASTPVTGNNNLIRLVSQTTRNYSAAIIGLGKYEDDGNARSELSFKVANTSLSANLAEFKFRGDGEALLPGNVLIGGTLPSAPAIELNADGTAEFASTIITDGRVISQTTSGQGVNFQGKLNGTDTCVIQGNGSATFAGTVKAAGSAGGVDSITAGTTGAPKYFVVRGNGTVLGNDDGDASTSSYKYRLNASGSAMFAGDVEAGEWDGANTTGTLVQAGGGFVAARDATNSNKNQAYVWQGRDGSTRTSTIAQDGSATFAGAGTFGSSISTSGGRFISDRTSSSNPCFAARLNGVENASILADGSAEFSGSVSIGGTAAANTIDSYEEGTFTPAFVGSATPGSPVYATNGIAGKYVRIGQTCHIEIYIDVTDLGGATGFYRINGLPFNANFSLFGNGFMRLFATVKDVASGAYGTHNTNFLFIKLADGTGNLPVQTGRVTINASYTIL